MTWCLNGVLEPQKVNNDESPLKEIESDLTGVFKGGYWIEIDEWIEPTYLQGDIRYYADPLEDSVYP